MQRLWSKHKARAAVPCRQQEASHFHQVDGKHGMCAHTLPHVEEEASSAHRGGRECRELWVAGQEGGGRGGLAARPLRVLRHVAREVLVPAQGWCGVG